VDQAVLDAVRRSAVAVVVVDVGGVIQQWSAGAERLFGWTAEEAVGRDLVDIGLVADPVRRRRFDQLLAEALADGGTSGEWIARRSDGSTVRVHSVHEPLLDPDDPAKAIGIVTLSFDLTEREGFEAALVREALLDRLTGLPGRSVLQHELAKLIAQAPAIPAPFAAVLFIDLDRFKSINDTHGHDAGDRVLVEVARRLRGAVRAEDVVGRVGGDEFVVLARVRGDDGSADVTERVAASLAAPVLLGTVAVDVAASIGVALVEAGDDADDVIRRADAAMYRAKGTRASTEAATGG
jgi:diguanylate cyclase (GGDEF)-like protein/PAS domain S-box-containing protein